MVRLFIAAIIALCAVLVRLNPNLINTISEQERIQIELTNNGYAIPAEVAENIFTLFFTTKTDGSGIGLAVSRQIIRLHGGSLRLKHNSEGRVTFAIVVE